ncbi:MAG: hypothetical protein L0Y48_02520 [Fusobacteria bacterium]|nr:hypothetical protein [Fusobacteriota bacterium]
MKVDFHIHSDLSDGRFSYYFLEKLIKANQIKHFSITDHDIYDHMLDAFFMSDAYKYYPGMEISAKNYTNNRKVHFLTYNFNKNSPIFNEYSEYFIDLRNKNIEEILKNLIDSGYKFDQDKLETRKSKGLAIYKQHVMVELIKAGYDHQIHGELYKKLKQEGIFTDIKYLSWIEAVKLIKDIDGLVILAHPGLYDSWELLEDLKGIGLDGIEAFHSKHNDEETLKALDIAQKNNILITGGSDYHGWKAELPGIDIEIKYIKDFLKNT